MNRSQTCLRFLIHLLFWGGFFLLIKIQVPEASLKDYLDLSAILSITAAVVYCNLYVLMNLYFSKNKKGQYFLLLILLIITGAAILTLALPTKHPFFSAPFYQNCINLVGFIIITSSLRFYREINRRQIKLVELQNKQLQTELSLLKAQVNPHFLFNTLNNLYGLILQDKTEKAGEITLRLSDLMRYLLETSKAEKVSLNSEIKFINDYLEVEKIRIDKSSDVFFEVSGLEKDVLVAPMLFIPIVENIFKYGKFQKNDVATVSLAIQGNELFFEAMNTIDTNVTITVEKSGTGLENLKKRLEIIYPNRHLLDIEDDKKIFKVTLQITFQKDELHYC